MKSPSAADVEIRDVRLPPLDLEGIPHLPAGAQGIVAFAHGSGRLSPHNRHVAAGLQARGFATLLFDLLRPEEEPDRANVFDIPLPARRLALASGWLADQSDLSDLPLGLFGASTGAAAALVAAAEDAGRVRAVVSRGGRPDLAGGSLVRGAAAPLE
jgi:putative phosphoribosyl transferase